MKYLALILLLLPSSLLAADSAKRPTLVVDGDTYQVYNCFSDVRPSRTVNPICPKSARDERRGGEVLVGALVDAKGKVTKTFVVKAVAKPDIQEAARNAVGKWRFPKQRGSGDPASYVVLVPIMLASDR